MDDLERYLSIRSAYGASLRADGEQLSFLLDTTGIPEVWSLSGPERWPVQRTFGDERVLFCTHPPEGTDLVYGRDEGGNERTQFFKLDADDGAVTPLTATPDAKHYWGGFTHDGERFAFASNRRDEAAFDVYTQGLDEQGEEATMVHQGEGIISPVGYDPDDDRLLVVESHSSFDQDVYVLTLEDDDLQHLTPHEGPVRFQSPRWGPNGDGVYCVTDLDADTLNLVRIDAADGTIESVVEDADWNIDGIAIDDESGNLVYSRNVDGYTELTVGRFDGPTTIEAFPAPDLPEGTAGGVSFGPDGERFALSAASRTVNTNVYVVETETGETERWTAAPTAGIPRDTFRAPDLVHVDSFDDLEVPGFLTLPEDADGETPVIVDVHGGPESQRRPSFGGLYQYFLANGYALFEPNVRGSSGYGKAYTHLDDVEQRMDSVADLEACADWLAAHEAIDPDRIAVMGGSYGGFMVLAAMTTYPDRWAAGVDVVGIANFVTFLENTGAWRRSHREAEYGSLEEDREFLESISPINHVEDIRAPLFVIHGANDPRVPVEEAEQIAEAAADHVPVETLIFEDEGHGLSKLENRIEAYGAVVDFLDEHV